ncbi:MAG TPA: hypothetical protein DDW52_18265 [Planctomycetaceae bacterium]|nr:hypothetical protein [Planctomycetaceae bacterium]
MRILFFLAMTTVGCGLVFADEPKPSRGAKIDKLLKRIEQLEQRVRELEKRPPVITPSPYYQPGVPTPDGKHPKLGRPVAPANEVQTNRVPGPPGARDNSVTLNGSAPTYQRQYSAPHAVPFNISPYVESKTEFHPVPNKSGESKRKHIPDSWSPFYFNGQEYYIIPLGEAKALMDEKRP